MRRDQAEVIKELKETHLGLPLWRAAGDYEALGHDNAFERPMSAEELEAIRVGIDELQQAAGLVFQQLERFHRRYKASLTEYESERINNAISDIGRSTTLLASAENTAESAQHSDEAADPTDWQMEQQEKLHRYLRGGLSFLRAAWDSLFYALQRPRHIEQVQLNTERSLAYQSDAKFRNEVELSARERSDESGYIVEVYNAAGALVFSTSPDVRALRTGGRPRISWQWRPRPLAPVLTFARPLSLEERGVVREALVSEPGITVKQLGQLVGVEITKWKAPQEQMTANPNPEQLRESLFSIQM